MKTTVAQNFIHSHIILAKIPRNQLDEIFLMTYFNGYLFPTTRFQFVHCWPLHSFTKIHIIFSRGQGINLKNYVKINCGFYYEVLRRTSKDFAKLSTYCKAFQAFVCIINVGMGIQIRISDCQK